jgi:hypothetical protein
MGRIVFGIDIDEHPMGGLIERLLTEEDIEKLRESPRTAPDGGTSSDDPTDGDSPAETDPDGDVASSGGSTADPESTDDAGVDDAVASDDDRTDRRARTTPPTAGIAGTNEWRARALDESETEADDSGLVGRIPGIGDGPDADEEKPPLITRVRKGLLFASLGAVGLGIVAAALRRFLGRFEPEAEPEPDDGECCASSAKTHTPAASAASEPGTSAADVEGLGGEEDGSPLGALLGLGLLAVVAALVRKFEETDDAEIPVEDGER